MNKDFILTIDNFLTAIECNDIIKNFKDNTVKGESDYLNYLYNEIEDTYLMPIMYQKLLSVITKYKELYPEIDLTSDPWEFTQMRFKHFKPHHAFNSWHSEHSRIRADRILGIQIYLTDHNCGTEFYNGSVIQSKVGRLTMFPCYFTHTHRGQVCPENKDRYLLTGYYNYIF